MNSPDRDKRPQKTNKAMGAPKPSPSVPPQPSTNDASSTLTVEFLTESRPNVFNPTGTPRFPVILPLRGEAAWKRYQLDKPEVRIGRDSQTDIMLKDSKVSRQHARILWENHNHPNECPRCILEDCQSHNGTFLNRRRITRVSLSDGDRIQMGSTLLGFFIKDAVELEYDNQLLSHAITDSLTGLANRVSFEEEAQRSIALARQHNLPLCFAIIDLDGFKTINDTRGHATGDALLFHLAGIMIKTMRKSDILGRLGGDEFGILLPDTDLHGAAVALDQLRHNVSNHPLTKDGEAVTMTISIGAAQYDSTFKSWHEFYEKADAHLYLAKKNGRNRLCVRTVDA